MPDFDWGDHGPYPESWSDDVVRFWETEPNTYEAFYTETEWSSLQEAFTMGFVNDGVDPDDREAYREAFFQLAGITPDSFDWDAFREYHGY